MTAVSRPPASAFTRPPKTLPVVPEAIPQELRSLCQWVCWRWELRDGKWTKPPHQPSGQYAACTRRETWGSFEEAFAAYQRGEFDGVGFVLTDNDPYAAVDLDHCRDPHTGHVEEWAREIIAQLPTYWEISPSGTGLRAMARATLPPKGRKEGDKEMYDSGRYVTITGDHLEEGEVAISDCQEAITCLHAHLFGDGNKPEANQQVGSGRVLELDDDELP